jgi:phosphoglycerate dehydrogenase-like enzyme
MAAHHVLMSRLALAACRPSLEPLIKAGRLKVVTLPPDGEPSLEEALLVDVTAAFFSRDLHLAPSPGGNESARALFKAAQRAPRLQWLQIFFAGINDVPVLGRLMERGVRVTTAAGAGAPAIAQTVLAALMAISRGFLHHLEVQRRREWSPLSGASVPVPIAGQTATIVGLGPIGREVARILQFLGMHTVGVRRSIGDVDHCSEVFRYEDLREVLPRTDWLILTCPLTELTRQLVNGAAIEALPRGAKVINVSRGEVVDEEALTEALRNGQVSAAYLDVFSQEPLPESSPLWSLPNVLLSAHTANASTDYDEKVAAIFMDNLVRFLEARPLLNPALSNA